MSDALLHDHFVPRPATLQLVNNGVIEAIPVPLKLAPLARLSCPAMVLLVQLRAPTNVPPLRTVTADGPADMAKAGPEAAFVVHAVPDAPGVPTTAQTPSAAMMQTCKTPRDMRSTFAKPVIDVPSARR